MSPFDSITRKRPLAERSLANDPTWFVADVRFEFEIWVKKASGVLDEVDCADEESAPATSIHAAAAHRKAITSLIIKKPKLGLSAIQPAGFRPKNIKKT
jgi:hypothetical protein